MEPFNDRAYTQDALIKQFGLIELHGKDGSAVDADCQCIETKHTYLIEGLAEEGMGFALSTKEKEFYGQVADLARQIRKRIEMEDWNLHGAMRTVMKTKYPIPHNPLAYLPHGLTSCEIKFPSVRKKLSSCIKTAEKRPGAYHTFNPIAICRASIKCPP